MRKDYNYKYYSGGNSSQNKKNKTKDSKNFKNLINSSIKQSGLKDDSNLNGSNICGIINVGNNCYLNSGLQIIASCKELEEELNRNNNHGYFVNLLKSGINELLNSSIYDPTTFINNFCSNNSDFIRGTQCCSQNFIRTLIRNINNDYISKKNDLVTENKQYNRIKNNINSIEYAAYQKFIDSNGIYPESKAQSIFSGITKSHSKGRCFYCQKQIEDYSFSYFIDQNMYLDEINARCKFSDVLKSNIGNENNLLMNCPKCKKEINIKEKTKLIKLPQILIFTLERYLGQTNNVEIIPDKTLDMKFYIDDALICEETEYELFAINIRFGRSANFGHEICQVKRNGQWYEINDSYGKKIDNPSKNDSSYGLFYRKKHKLDEDEKDLIISGFTNNISNNINNESKDKVNIENNNYLYCGLQIMATFDSFIDILKNSSLIKKNCISSLTYNIVNSIKKKDNYDLSNFIDLFSKNNLNYSKGSKNCSQNFIITLLKNINKDFINNNECIIKENNIMTNNKQYIEFIKKKLILPESKALALFSIITKNNIHKCCSCGNKYFFNYNIGLNIYLGDNQANNKFSNVLYKNLTKNNLKNNCNKCNKEIKIKETKIIKLPEILIFTLERNKNESKINDLKIEPDENISMANYIDDSLKNEKTEYELFAINIGKTSKYDHQICQVKKDGKWFEIDDNKIKPINNAKYQNSFYGLFYRKKHN